MNDQLMQAVELWKETHPEPYAQELAHLVFMVLLAATGSEDLAQAGADAVAQELDPDLFV